MLSGTSRVLTVDIRDLDPLSPILSLPLTTTIGFQNEKPWILSMQSWSQLRQAQP